MLTRYHAHRAHDLSPPLIAVTTGKQSNAETPLVAKDDDVLVNMMQAGRQGGLLDMSWVEVSSPLLQQLTLGVVKYGVKECKHQRWMYKT